MPAILGTLLNAVEAGANKTGGCLSLELERVLTGYICR